MAPEETYDLAFVTGDPMATIIEFRASSSRTAGAPPRGVRANSGEVVIFPGVRYQRWSDESAVKPRGKKTRRRDTLEFEE